MLFPGMDLTQQFKWLGYIKFIQEKSFKKVVCVWDLQLKALTESPGFNLQVFLTYVLGKDLW